MELARLTDVTHNYGADPILRGVTMHINKGQKLGLIGANGCGKTTLLKILTGAMSPTAGKAGHTPGVRIGYVPQQVAFEPGDTVMDCLLSDQRVLTRALREAEEGLALADADTMDAALKRYEVARDAFEQGGGDQLATKARAILDALGLPDRGEQAVAQLSGGEKSILALARALMGDPELLILDEPGNHLDHQGLAWLEDFIKRHRGAALIVSHNRYLLDRVVDGLFHLDQGQLKYYNGGYSSFRATHLRELMAQHADYVANQKRLDGLEALVKRFAIIARQHADPAWGKRLRARRSQLAREQAQAVDKPVLDERAMRLDFDAQASRADIALHIEGYQKAFDDLVLFEDAELHVSCGERVALVGLNGSGKTSLLRDIEAHGAWDAPHIRIGPSMKIGFGAQEHAKHLNAEHNLIESMTDVAPMSRDAAFSVLSRFLFSWEECQKKTVGQLSGGERGRLQLARLMVQKPNFLILDEPTNHLDIPAREAIEEALESFEGTLLVVSHDRYFLDKLVDRVVEVDNKQLVSWSGNFTSFWFARQKAAAPALGRVQKRRRQREVTAASAPTQSRKAAAQADMERRINDTEAQKVDLEKRAAEAFRRNDHRKGRELSKRLEQVKHRLDALYEQWVD